MSLRDQSEQQASRPTRRGFIARLARDREGATAVEFALISIPFLTLLFAIIETGLMFFVGQMLDGATAEVSRQIRVGTAQQANMTAEQMKDALCQEMVNLISCDDSLKIDVRSYDAFASADLGSPLKADGSFGTLKFDMGKSSSIVVVRAFYTWPTFFHLLPGGNTLPDGKRLLSAILAFRNEPFPW